MVYHNNILCLLENVLMVDGVRGRPRGRGKKIGITIPERLDNLLNDFSELVEKPKATLITEYLMVLEPILLQNIEYYKKIKSNDLSQEEVKKYFFNMLADYNQNFSDVLRQINND